MNLTFEKMGHKYFLDDKPLTGVTSVLSVIAKPSLIQWAANEAVNYIEKILSETIAGKEIDWASVLQEARVAHRRKKEEAGMKGTGVHLLIEEMIKGVIGVDEYEFRESANPQIRHFIEWCVKNKVKFLASEKIVYSESLWLAGTLDFICEIDGKKYICYLKTNSGIFFPE